MDLTCAPYRVQLSDCLLSAAGQLNAARSGEACALDEGLEAERGITIYSSAVALRFPSHDLSINLIDCPGHAEFNSEVTAALRLTDGALLLVDAKEGVMPQTEAVLRQALADGVRVVLVLNKLDKLLPDRFVSYCPPPPHLLPSRLLPSCPPASKLAHRHILSPRLRAPTS